MEKEKEMVHGKAQMENLLKESIWEIKGTDMGYICGLTGMYMKDSSDMI